MVCRHFTLKEKKDFFFKFVSVLLSTKPRGGGQKVLVDCALKKELFFLFVTCLTKSCSLYLDYSIFSYINVARYTVYDKINM